MAPAWFRQDLRRGGRPLRRQQSGLQCAAGHVGLRPVEGGREHAEPLVHQPGQHRYPRGATDQEQPGELVGTLAGVGDRLRQQRDGALHRPGDQPLEVIAGDVGGGERRRHGNVGDVLPGQLLLGGADVLAQHSAAAAVGELAALDQAAPAARVGTGNQPAGVLEQQLVDVRAAEVRVAAGSQHMQAHTGPADHRGIRCPTTQVQDGQAAAVGYGVRLGVEHRDRDRLGHEHHLGGKPVCAAAQLERPGSAPVRGMGEHQLVERRAGTEPACLLHHATQHRTDDVDHRKYGVTERQLGLVDAPLQVWLVPGRVRGGLAVGLVADEQRAVRRDVDRGWHQRRAVHINHLRRVTCHGHRRAGVGGAEVHGQP